MSHLNLPISSITAEQQQLLGIMLDKKRSPRERADAGRNINEIGDPRPGVGLRPDGLPDIVWCEVPDGTFIMGHAECANEYRKRLINVPAFSIAKYPITYQQFQAFIDDKDGYKDPIWWQGLNPNGVMQQKKGKGDQRWKFSNHPREMVSWWDAMAFCRWLSARLGYKIKLPSDEQWEKAARGTDERLYPYGNDFDATKGNTEETGIGQTNAVGLFPAGASPSGLLDVLGNVSEWTLTEYSSGINNRLSSDLARGIRGGSWKLPSAYGIPARSGAYSPGSRLADFGFRICTTSALRPENQKIDMRDVLVTVKQLDLTNPDPIERAAAYRILGSLDADTRPGVGLLANGLPDIVWCEVPAGDFIYHNGETRTLPVFYIAKYPITYKQFQAFIDAPDGFKNSAWWEGFHPDGLRQQRSGPRAQSFKFWNNPREKVSWYDAAAFCYWLSARYTKTSTDGLPVKIRLPTDEEWEKAAYRTDELKDQTPGKADVDGTTAVGIVPADVSSYGVMDMGGDLWEWTSTNFQMAKNDDIGTAFVRVLCCRSSFTYGTSRLRGHPAARDFLNSGFRIACSKLPTAAMSGSSKTDIEPGQSGQQRIAQ